MTELALEYRDIVLEFGSGTTGVRALDEARLEVPKGMVMAVIGESGSGKSTMGFAAGRLMPYGVRPKAGTLKVLGQEVWEMETPEIRDLRRRDLRYIFQDPFATLDPTKRIGQQLREAAFRPVSDDELMQSLDEMGMDDPARVAASWPHELSGGMAQRVVIAMALIADPKIIIADEATSALDASVRTRILELLRDRSRERGITLLLLSHDLWAMRRFCDRVAVMYGGRVVEVGPVEGVFGSPAHPYTQQLLAASVGHEAQHDRLTTIPGMPPVLIGACKGCAFANRCPHADETRCHNQRPRPEEKAPGWSLLCHHWQRIEGEEARHEAA